MTAVFPCAESDPVAATALAAHQAATTGIHGVADTSLLVLTSDPRLGGSLSVGGGLRRALETQITAFQAGHGWVASGTGSQTDDTGTLMIGTQSLRLTPNADTTPQLSTKTLGAPIDLSASYLRLWVFLGGVVGSFKLRVASGNIATDYAEVDIWNSTGVGAPIWIATGQWDHATITRAQFTVTGVVDWTAITTMRLAVTALGAGTANCRINRIVSVPSPAAGVVSFTFDDGLASQYSRALQKLSEYGFPATAYIIADMIDTGTSVDSRGAMSTTSLKDLQQRYGWEIGSHAFYLANHNQASGFSSLTTPQVEDDMYRMRQWLANRGLEGGDQFAWPKGIYSGNAGANLDLARKYFSCARSTNGFVGGLAEAVFPHSFDRHRMRGMSVNGLTQTPAVIATAVTQAIARKEWLILAFHEILASGVAASSTDFAKADFATVVADVAAQGIAVRTVGDVLRNGA